MRAVIQRAKRAKVVVEGEVVAKIEEGLLLFLAVGKDDSEKDVEYLSEKVVGLRIFEDDNGRMNLSVEDIKGDILVVSQFTLYGDCRKGKRPSFDESASPDTAEQLYNLFVERIGKKGIRVETGRFGTIMDVHLVNSGPVTIMLDSKKLF